MTSQIRLNKFLAERIGVSRREADELIASGKVLVNNQKATLGAHIDKNDKVCYNNKEIPHEADFLYLAFNKPVGYVCSRRAQGSAPTIYDLLPKKYHHLKTVGRLDKDSSGLIILTNDGDFAFQMTHPKFRKNKIYEIELNKPLEPLHQQMIMDYGVMLDDGVSRFKIVKYTGVAENGLSKGLRLGRAAWEPSPRKTISDRTPAEYFVVLNEGRNRQIRRTFAALGYHVTKLHRTEFGMFKLDKLPLGQFQIIDKKEIKNHF